MTCRAANLPNESSVWLWVAIVVVVVLVIGVTAAVAFYEADEIKQLPSETPKSVVDVVKNVAPSYDNNGSVVYNTTLTSTESDGVSYFRFSPSVNSLPSQVRLVTTQTTKSSGVYPVSLGVVEAYVNLYIASMKNVKVLTVSLLPAVKAPPPTGPNAAAIASNRKTQSVAIAVTRLNPYGEVVNKLFPIRLKYDVQSQRVAADGLVIVVEETEPVDVTKSTFVEIEGRTSSVLLKYMNHTQYSNYYNSFELATDMSNLGPKDKAVQMIQKRFGVTLDVY